MAEKRHLPVIGSGSRDEGPRLAPLEWVLVGSLCILLLFMPLGLLGLWVSLGLSRPSASTEGQPGLLTNLVWLRSLITILPLLASFALAAFTGSAVVGRFAAGAKRGLPTYAGLLAAVLVVALAYVQGALRPPLLLGIVLSILLLLGGVFSRWGGAFGLKFRR